MNKYLRKRLSVIYRKAKEVKIEPKQIIKNECCYIKDNIKFNEYGLYLVAEIPSNYEMQFTYFLSLNFILTMYNWLIPIMVGFAISKSNYNLNYYFKKFLIKLYIKEIYLTKDMDCIVIKPFYEILPIKNIRILSPEEFEKNNFSKQYFIFMVNKKTYYIPSNIIIHNKEIFSAIFNGLVIKYLPKPGYIKLKTNDKINYYI